MKILVIGGCGFIGSHIVDRLIEDRHEVRVLDRRMERFRPPLPGVDYVIGSFADRMTLIEALTGMDLVFHLASTTVPGTANLAPQADVQDNLLGTLVLVETMVEAGVRRLLYLSSGGTVYGVHEGAPIAEEHPLLPINSYGIVKVAVERYLEMFRRTEGLSSVVIRPSNPYGPRQGHMGVQGVVSTFLNRVQKGEPIEIWGDGRVVRDYFCVTDLARLCVMAGVSDETGVFNAGSGVGTSLNALVSLIGDVTGRRAEPVYRPGRAVDVPCSVLDVSRAQETFGWRCTVPLAEGIRQCWEWMLNLRSQG
jgi:UDP-glucose 4-epimerase